MFVNSVGCLGSTTWSRAVCSETVSEFVCTRASSTRRQGINRGRNDSIEITIDDDGPGIPEAQRQDVFRPFWRLDESRNPETGGTGLGLAIARDVARGHGGDIVLQDSPHGGLRARIYLPI